VNELCTIGLPTAYYGYGVAVQHEQAPTSITELYDRFRGPAFSLARRIIGDDVLAEDVLQDAFLSIWRTPGGFDPARGGFSTWVMSIVHHKAVDAVRREQSQRDRQARVQLDMEVAAPAMTVDVGDAVCDRAVAQRVRTALAALPPAQRQALGLAYFSGYTQSEIASLTGAPLGTVKTRMRSGMGQLRKVLHEVASGPAGAALAEA
jgi:RNA polymerase sigma factor (sigma-70 family)